MLFSSFEKSFVRGGRATAVTTVKRGGKWIVGVRVADTVRASAFHKASIAAKLLGEASHVVSTPVMKSARPPGTEALIMHVDKTYARVFKCVNFSHGYILSKIKSKYRKYSGDAFRCDSRGSSSAPARLERTSACTARTTTSRFRCCDPTSGVQQKG